MDGGQNAQGITNHPTPGTSNTPDQNPAISALVNLVTALTNKVDTLTQKVEDNADTLRLNKFQTKRDFRKKGNEVQHNLNDSVINTLDVAVKYNDAGRKDKANSLMRDSMSVLNTRNKHIDIADQSDYGFKVVEIYERPNIAEDDADFKKITRAEAQARAEHKRAADADMDSYRNTKRGRGSYRGGSRGTFSGYTNPPFNPSPPPYAQAPYYAQQPFYMPQMPQMPFPMPPMPPMSPFGYQQPFHAAPGFSQWANSGSNSFQQPRQSNPRCYNCQQLGHIARNCPQKSQQQSGGVPYKR